MCAPVPENLDVDPTAMINRMTRQALLLPIAISGVFGLGCLALGGWGVGRAFGWW